MKHLFLFSLSIFFYKSLFSQICPPSVREMPGLSISVPSGYHGNLEVEVPGESNAERADSCLAKLISQFPQVMDDIDVKQQDLIITNWYEAVEYQQYIGGIPLYSRGLWFQFNNNGLFSAMYLFMETDSLTLTELETLAAQGTEGVHMIRFINGEYQLVEIQEIQDPAPPDIDGVADVSIEVTYPVYLNGCKDITISPTIPTSFSTGQPLIVSGTNRLDGKYADPGQIPTFTFPTNEVLRIDCDWTSCEDDAIAKHEALMCYYHLNHTLEYIDNNFPDNFIVEHVTFYRYTQDEEDAPSVYIGSNNQLSINFSGNCENGIFHDIAEDADHIVSSAFESFMVANNLKVPTGDEHGVGAGILTYWTWRYMVHKNFAHTNIGGFAGSESSPIDLLTTNTFDNIIPGANRENASIWAATLHDIFTKALGEDENLMNRLLLATALLWEENTNQPEAAVMLYETARLLTPLTINEEQFCIIGYILAGHGQEYIARYPQTIDWPQNLNYFEIGSKNYYIKDTHEGLVGNILTGEDRGQEENIVSTIFDRSPSIWNCLTADCDEHHRPVSGTTNYLRVLVSNQGCDWSAIDGTLEVYAAFTAWNEKWPDDWGGDINNDGQPDDTYYNYYGGYVLVGKRIGTISLDNFIEDPEGNGRIYTIGWTPWAPFGNKPWAPQLNYLARIVSEDDPFHNSAHGPASVYVQDNNNVARLKLSITLVAAPEPNPVPTPIAIGSLLGYRKQITDDLFLTFEYLNSSFSYTDANFDSLGIVKLIFPPNFLKTYGQELPQGGDHSWINDSTLLITGPDFALPLYIDTDSIYPLQIQYTPNGSFQPISFNLNIMDENSCNHGGEYFEVNNTGIVPRSDEIKNSLEADITGFPNPAYDQYTLDIKGPFEPVQLNVFNIMGQSMRTHYDSQTRSFSLSTWPGGLYIVQVILSNGQSKTLQFIKTQ